MLKRDTVGLIQSDIQNRRIKQAQICSKGHFAPVYFCKIKKSVGGKMGIGSTNGIRRRAKKREKGDILLNISRTDILKSG